MVPSGSCDRIGSNNLEAGDAPADVSEGIRRVIDQIRQSQPEVRIVLMAIFPRGYRPTDPWRQPIEAANRLLSRQTALWGVEWLDIGRQLMDDHGRISQEIMFDAVHLTPKGYGIWAEALAPILAS